MIRFTRNSFTRRHVLRGMLHGSAVTVALPLLNCVLNDNGNAYADGAPLPVRFGTWFWGLGINKAVGTPAKLGAGFDLPDELAALADVRDHINYITNLNAYRDGAFFCHYTGWIVARTGTAPTVGDQPPAESLDVTIANSIGRSTRFKNLSLTATGDVRSVVSFENANTPATPEISPLGLYTRIFGADFQDPNAAEFKPDPHIMVRKSVLTPVMDQIKDLNRTVPAEDKERLDQYFTGLRALEQQFEHQLTKPEPRAACKAPPTVKEDLAAGNEASLVGARHNAMADLLAMAVACDQTRVFNMCYSIGFANTTKPGYDKPHHTCTHEEPSDEKLGYQPNHSWYVRRAMETWGYYVRAFAKIKEGEGTLLDNCLILANTDVSNARVHSIEQIPSFTAGRAGGRIKTGNHIDGKSAKITNLSLTALRAMGLDINTWGTKSNQTDSVVSDILV